MLEKPTLKNEALIACLEKEFALQDLRIVFLPLGVDPNSAVYRADSGDQTSYFVKLRSGNFDETSVTLPKYLSDMGIRPIIAPLATTSGQLWANLMDYKVILYPFH